MTDTNLINKEKHAVGGVLNLDRLKRVMDGRIKIQQGAAGYIDPTDKQICIMEATHYILGGDPDDLTDEPPCTSESIAGFMIGVNDTVSDRKRAQLKKVIADVVNTAPTVWVLKTVSRWDSKLDKNVRYKVWNLEKDRKDKDYREAERKRSDMINIWAGTHAIEKTPMHVILDFVRELAAVAKFHGEKPMPELPENNNQS